MRRILFLPFVLLAIFTFTSIQNTKAQTVNLFVETFDSLGIDSFKMGLLTIPASDTTIFFTKDSVVTKNMSAFSAVDTVGNRTTSYLVAPMVALGNYDNIGVSFDQICYIDWFDEAVVEYSFDGTTWDRLPLNINNNGNIERVYTGASLYQTPQRAFSKLSRPIAWPFLDSFFVFPRNTTAWATETFSLAPVIDREERRNSGVRPDSVQIRLGLVDNPASEIGRSGLHKWYIDNFTIRGSNCELIPPNLVLDDPPADYPSRYEERVYDVGPYTFDAQISDASQISRAYIAYRVERDTSQTTTPIFGEVYRDTVDLTFLGFTRYTGQIDSSFINQITNAQDRILPGDTVYWKIEAVDNSPCFNITSDPPAGYESFQVRPNLPAACATQPIFNFPYYQTFNGPDFQVSESGVLAESWINAQGDFHDFWVWADSTNDYPNSGPRTDHPGGGKYLLLESTGYRDSTAYLLSPCIDLFDSPNNLIRFYMNQNGIGGDTVHLDVFDPTPRPGLPDGRFVNDVIPPIGGNKGDNWLPYEINTYQFRGKVVQLRWRAATASDNDLSDIGFDSVKIVPAPVFDLRCDRVEVGPYIPHSASTMFQDTVNLVIQNLGAVATDSFDVSYEIYQNGALLYGVGPLRYYETIQPGDNVTLNLNRDLANDLYEVPLGQYSIKAWVDYVPDETASNDTTLANTRGLFYNDPIGCTKEFFDDVNYWVGLANDTATFSNKWELGTPNFDRTNSAFTKPNSWDVLLNRGYAGAGTVEQLVTQFYSTEGADSVIMAFMNNRAMENTKDGVFIEYSLDRGLTWDYLANLNDTAANGDTLSKHWYNSFLSSGGFGGQFVFSDTTRNIERNFFNWVESELMLPDNLENQKEILFRFMFFSEEEPGGSAGMSIDNFLVYDQHGVDLEPHFIRRPIDQCDLSANVPFSVIVKNRGNVPVNTFDISYIVESGPNGSANYQIGTETINRTIAPRDTIHVKSQLKFDFFELGFYDIAAVTTTLGDVCSANDTLRKEVENIDGCSFIFEIATGAFRDGKTAVDSSIWRFDITNGNKKYVIEDDYVDLVPQDTMRQLICIKSGSQVRFQLGDVDTAISTYSLIAFNGENDTILINQEVGGASPTKFFDWFCPPERSAELEEIIVTTTDPLPFEGPHNFAVQYRNNGLDSIDRIKVNLLIDNDLYVVNDTINPPDPLGLKYNRSRRIGFPPAKNLSPGVHTITAWVAEPNDLPDLLPTDDTLSIQYTVIDNGVFRDGEGLDSNGNPIILLDKIYCTTFEDTAEFRWISVFPYRNATNVSLRQREQSFERSTPAGPDSLIGAYSGDKAWITKDTGNYKDLDATSLLSPAFQLHADSCYRVSFWNNYMIRDQFNDGGQFQLSSDSGDTWITIFYGERDSIPVGDTTLPLNINFQKNWHNAKFIKSITDPNTSGSDGGLGTSGWTGNSNGWVQSENIFGGILTPVQVPDSQKNYTGIFRFRFESDGSVTDEGWAIDDFCVEKINPIYCGTVGLEEQLAKIRENEVFVGQNIPNPARQTTSIPYYLPEAASVNFRVSSMTGQDIYYESSTMPKGTGFIELDVSDYAQGIYFYTFDIDGESFTKKMIITK